MLEHLEKATLPGFPSRWSTQGLPGILRAEVEDLCREALETLLVARRHGVGLLTPSAFLMPRRYRAVLQVPRE